MNFSAIHEFHLIFFNFAACYRNFNMAIQLEG